MEKRFESLSRVWMEKGCFDQRSGYPHFFNEFLCLRMLFSALSFCLFFGVCFAFKESDSRKSLTLLKGDCLKGDTISCAKWGVQLEQSGETLLAKKAYYRSCWADTNPQGMTCYLWGLLQNKKQEKLKGFKRACDLDDADGCTAIGMSYEFQKKWNEANQYFQKGCQFKDGRSCFRLGRRYILEKQLKKGMKLIFRACELGYSTGCGYAGWRMETKLHQRDKAREFYRKGCDQGSKIECARLGMLLAKMKNRDKALHYLQLSCKKGHALACKKHTELKSMKLSVPAVSK